MSRTTLDIDDHVIEELKHTAAEQRESMSKVANRLLRTALRRERKRGVAASPMRWNIVQDGTPASGFDPATRDYLDLLEEE